MRAAGFVLISVLVIFVFAACGTSAPSEAEMAGMLESGTSVHDVTCVKRESSDRQFDCKAKSDEGNWQVKLAVRASESGGTYIVVHCEDVEDSWGNPCTEIH